MVATGCFLGHLFALWKYRNGCLVPGATPFNLNKALFFVLINLEAYRLVLDSKAKSFEVFHVWAEKELAAEWDWLNLDIQGQDWEQKLDFFHHRCNEHYVMVKRIEFEKRFVALGLQFRANHILLFPELAAEESDYASSVE